MTESQRIKIARVVAVAADLAQIALFPAFMEGALSPVNDAVDVAVAVVMMWLLGWHWAFLPTFAAELVPFVGLVPTWTAAVLFVTRAGTPTAADEAVSQPIDVTPERPPRIDSPRRGDET